MSGEYQTFSIQREDDVAWATFETRLSGGIGRANNLEVWL
jgi:hypothetical protein